MHLHIDPSTTGREGLKLHYSKVASIQEGYPLSILLLFVLSLPTMTFCLTSALYPSVFIYLCSSSLFMLHHQHPRHHGSHWCTLDCECKLGRQPAEFDHSRDAIVYCPSAYTTVVAHCRLLGRYLHASWSPFPTFQAQLSSRFWTTHHIYMDSRRDLTCRSNIDVPDTGRNSAYSHREILPILSDFACYARYSDRSNAQQSRSVLTRMLTLSRVI